MSLVTLSISDLTTARKAVSKLGACNTFSGDSTQWPLWKFAYTSSLDCAGYEFSKMLGTTLVTATPTREQMDALVVIAKAVFGHLFRCLSDKDKALAMCVPHWTVKLAGISKIASEDTKETDELMVFPHPASVWKMLVDRYEPNTAAHVRRLLDHEQHLVMGDDFDEHVAHLEQDWAQLTAMGESVSDTMRMHRLLSSLPSWAEPVVSKIDADDVKYEAAVLTLRKFFSRQSALSSDDSSALATSMESARQRPLTGDFKKKDTSSEAGVLKKTHKSSVVCAHCYKAGHTIQQCWTLHPDQKPASASRNSNNSNRKVCLYCTRPGHSENECRTKARAQQLRTQQDELRTAAAHQISPDESEEQIDFLTALVSSDEEGNKNEFIVDSGAEAHVCNNRALFSEFVPLQRTLTLRGYHQSIGEKLTHKGTIRFSALVNGKTVGVELHDVLYVPNARINLLSTPALLAKGYGDRTTPPRGTVPGRWTLHRIDRDGNLSKEPVLEATLTRRRLVVHTRTATNAANSVCAVSVQSPLTESIITWHHRLAHMGLDNLKLLLSQLKIKTLASPEDELAVKNCSFCMSGKMHKKPVNKNTETRAREVLGRLHSDLCGPFKVTGRSREKYFMTVTDDASRYSFVEFLRNKAEAPRRLLALVKRETTRKKLPVHYLRSDGGQEYVCNETKNWLTELGIAQEVSPPYKHQYNGVAERLNGVLMEPARCMLVHSGLPQPFWPFAVSHACAIRRLTPTKANGGRTPHEIYTGAAPTIADLAELKPFGCRAWVFDRKASKLESKAIACVYLGRATNSNAFCLYDPARRIVLRSADVTFNENEFPLNKAAAAATTPPLNKAAAAPTPAPLPAVSSPLVRAHDSAETSLSGGVLVDAQDDDVDSDHDQGGADEQVDDGVESEHDQGGAGEQSADDDDQGGADDDHGGANHADDGLNDEKQQQPATAPRHSSRANRGVPSSMRFSDSLFANALALDDDPQSYEDALQLPDARDWRASMEKEINSLKKMDTWTLVPRPGDRHVLKNRWVLRRKYNEDGTVERYKARLVVKGFEQRYGLDYEETYAPVASYKSFKVLLALAALRGFKCHQLDVVSAFLNGTIDKEIFVEQPEGFGDGTDLVCHLKKSIYGLKQAPRIWNSDIHATLTRLGFTQCRSDSCVYSLRADGKLVYLLLWVDDMVLVHNDDTLCHRVISDLQSAYELQDRGSLAWVLGMSVRQDADAVRLCQETYIKKVLGKTGMTDCKPASTPAAAKSPVNDTEPVDETLYRSFAGMLLHAHNCTRADISYATVQVCRCMKSPTAHDLKAAKRVLRYLQGSAGASIKYARPASLTTDVQLHGYCDASWGEDPTTRRSVSGYVFFLGSGPISWSSKLQSTVALSTAESEFIALSAAAQEAKWLKMLLEELGYPQGPITIYTDSQSAKAIAEKSSTSTRSKHIDIRLFFLRDYIQAGTIKLEWRSSTSMTADIMTKPLGKTLFKQHARSLLE